MRRFYFIFLLFTTFLFAEDKTYNFIENKYIEALNEKVSKKGEITFSKEFTRIYYLPPNEKSLTQELDKITIQTPKETLVRTKEQEPNISIMFKIIKAVFSNDEKQIERYFKVTKKEANEVSLFTKSRGNPIRSLTYQLENGEMKRLEILGTDNSRIDIEILGEK
ncbi:MAG: hypothetical protein ACK5LP_01080 [Campylobacteraceae bacterium]